LFIDIFRTGAVQTSDLLSFEFPGTHFGECYLIRLL